MEFTFYRYQTLFAAGVAIMLAFWSSKFVRAQIREMQRQSAGIYRSTRLERRILVKSEIDFFLRARDVVLIAERQTKDVAGLMNSNWNHFGEASRKLRQELTHFGLVDRVASHLWTPRTDFDQAMQVVTYLVEKYLPLADRDIATNKLSGLQAAVKSFKYTSELYRVALSVELAALTQEIEDLERKMVD